jgi:fructose-1,6-bisphosphatase I
VADVIRNLAGVAIEVASIVARGPLVEDVGSQTADCDTKTDLDAQVNALVRGALTSPPVAHFASDQEETVATFSDDQPLAVAVNPLDCSLNLNVNISVGTIFSIFEKSPDGPTASFFRPGTQQLAAGYFIYGAHTALMLTVGQGVDLFVLDPSSKRFCLARQGIVIPPNAEKFAIDASNYRHWQKPVRTFIDDCLEGVEGPRGKNFKMRWVSSLVGETHSIFSRGGIFLCPDDDRPGFESGRLRLIFDAAPIAMLVEQAGGGATDGIQSILDKTPTALHQRVPFVFGAINKVDRIAEYHTNPHYGRETSPLFAQRGLFRS